MQSTDSARKNDSGPMREKSLQESRRCSTGNSLCRSQRLTRSALFKETYGQGCRYVGRYMVLWIRKGEGVSCRLGVVASKKVGNAVARARARRRLREAFRTHRNRFSHNVDIILVSRKGVVSAPWNHIVEELLHLSKQAGILLTEN